MAALKFVEVVVSARPARYDLNSFPGGFWCTKRMWRIAMSHHDSETVENIRPAFAASKYFVHSAGELRFDFGAASHRGLCRTENQDHYLVLRRARTQQLLLTNAPTEQLTLP